MSNFNCALQVINSLINESSFKERSKIKVTDFTRLRSLTFPVTIFAILDLAKKSLQISLNDFSKRLELKSITKQAFSLARRKIKAAAFKELNEVAINMLYFSSHLKFYKGKYLLLAIDGSTLELPKNKEITSFFGNAKNQSAEVPRARISILYDVLNRVILDSQIASYKSPEKELAIQHLQWLQEFQKKHKKKIILLLDRGYSCTGLFLLLNKLGIDFVCPAHVQNNQRIIKQVSPLSKDDYAKVTIDNTDIQKSVKSWFRIPKEQKLSISECPIRVVKTSRNILFTSLLDRTKFKKIKQLYCWRYSVEIAYRTLKLDTFLENFSGTKLQIVFQEFYSTVLVQNLARILEEDLCRRSKKGKKPNHRYILGLIKQLLSNFLIKENLKVSVDKIEWISIKKGRSWPRNFKKCVHMRFKRLCYA